MKVSHLPNFITIMRIIFIIPLYFALVSQNYLLSLILFCVAALSDSLDGYLARRFNWQSHLGAILDPLADKLIILVLTFMLAWAQHLWLVAAIAFILRDIIIIVGAIGYHFYIGKITIQPTIVSKINTALQLILILMILVNLAIAKIFSAKFLIISTYVVFVITIISGCDYIWRWGFRAYSTKKGLMR